MEDRPVATIGVQAMMLRNNFVPDGTFETLRAISDIGYHAVEVSQVPMTPENVAELARARDELGMDIASLSASLRVAPGMPGESLTTDFDKIVADCRQLDTTMLRIGMLPFDAMASLEKVLEFCDETNAVARRLADEGISLYYHNHHIEFMKLENGKYLLDVLRENAPHMGFELDTHWIHRGGENPVEFIKKYAGSVRLLHLKDYKIANVEMPDMRGADGMAKFVSAFFDKPVRFAELGAASLPLKACIEAGLAGGAEYFLIEQDDSYGRDPFDCLKDSRAHLVELGYADGGCLGTGRVAQRPEDVEHGRDPQSGADRRSMTEARVERGGERERDARFLQRGCHLIGAAGEVYAESRENVACPRDAADSTVAVLDHRDPR